MKKIIKITLLMVLCLILLQELQAQRRLPKTWGIQLNAGLGDGYGFINDRKVSYYTSLALSKYTRSGDKWLYGLEYFEKKYCYKCGRVPVSQINLEGGYYHNFYSNRGKDLFISAGFSLLGGYETLNWGNKVFDDGAVLTNKERILLGGALTLEFETFITDRLIVLCHFRERILNSDVGIFHTQIGIGFKYIYK